MGGCNYEANDPCHAAAAAATVTQSLHGQAAEPPSGKEGACQHQSLFQEVTNLRGQSHGRKPVARGGSAAGSSPQP